MCSMPVTVGMNSIMPVRFTSDRFSSSSAGTRLRVERVARGHGTPDGVARLVERQALERARQLVERARRSCRRCRPRP